MERLWAPWRLEYIKSADEVPGCVFCKALAGPDDEMLIVQRGKELGYTLGDTQFQGVLDNIRTQNKLENDEQFQAALKQEGLTMADLKEYIQFNRDFLADVQAAKKAGKSVDDVAKTWKIPAKGVAAVLKPPALIADN